MPSPGQSPPRSARSPRLRQTRDFRGQTWGRAIARTLPREVSPWVIVGPTVVNLSRTGKIFFVGQRLNPQVGMDRRVMAREVNDRIASLDWAAGDGETLDFHCECGDEDCTGVASFTFSEYAALRERGPLMMEGTARGSPARRKRET